MQKTPRQRAQDIRARGLKAQVSSLDDFDFEELPNQKIVPWRGEQRWRSSGGGCLFLGKKGGKEKGKAISDHQI